MSDTPRVKVVAALIEASDSAGRFLVQKRLPGGSRGSLWEFPGGKVEPGESDAEALIRECREELGVELSVGAARWHAVHQYRDLSVELVFYAAKIRAGAPRPLRAQQLRYLHPREMSKVPFCEADLPLIRKLQATSA